MYKLFATSLFLVYLALSSAVAQTQSSHTIGILADFNSSYGAVDYDPLVHKAVDVMIQDWQVDLVLMPGDVIAGQSHKLADDRFVEMWQGFDNTVAAPFREAGIPYVISVGNHDGSSQRSNSSFSYSREREATKTYWNENFSPLSYFNTENYPFQYSILYKDLFIISLDASSNRLLNDTDAWLNEQLSTPEAINANFRIILGHLPLFGVAQGKTKAGEVLADGAKLARLFRENNVDIYISGHHAAYYPATNGNQILIHAGGIMGRKLLTSEDASKPAIIKLVLTTDQTTATQTISVSGYDVRTFEEIKISELPASIEGINGTSYRLKQ